MPVFALLLFLMVKLGVCLRETECLRILTNKEIYGMVKKPTRAEIVRLNRLYWFGHVQRMEENRIPPKKF